MRHACERLGAYAHSAVSLSFAPRSVSDGKMFKFSKNTCHSAEMTQGLVLPPESAVQEPTVRLYLDILIGSKKSRRPEQSQS